MFSSVLITIHSLSFYTGNTEGLAQLVTEFLISFSIYPEGIFKGGIKYILYTIIPAGFMVYIPAKVFNDFNIARIFAVLAAALIWMCIAYMMFYRGLKKYESGNLILNKL